MFKYSRKIFNNLRNNSVLIGVSSFVETIEISEAILTKCENN